MRSIFFCIYFFMYFLNTMSQDIPLPKNYSIVSSVIGDLDKDKIDELVVVYNTKPENEFESIPRVLIIYKWINEKWKEWVKSNEAVYGSREGGMMGDPFEEIKITNGVLHVSQNGGSSWKWGFTDKYRYQNGAFYLIGYTSIAGKICEEWTIVDYNLSTGKITIQKEYETCKGDEEQKTYKTENETFFNKNLKITLQKRQEKKIKIISPKHHHDIHIAIGKD